MKRKGITILILSLLVITGCKGHPPKFPGGTIPDNPVPIDELDLPEGVLDIHPQKLLAGEGISIQLNAPEACDVSVTYPDSNGSGGWVTVDMVLEGKQWILPKAILEADGNVRYEGSLGDAVKGTRKIYTPFLWPPDEPYPIIIEIKIGNKIIQGYTTVDITGSLLEHLIYRPVDPRNPFPSGVTPVWEDHLHWFDGRQG